MALTKLPIEMEELEPLTFTYRDLLTMERAGILPADQHVELLGGHLFVMTVNPPHAATVTHLSRRFHRFLANRAQVINQSPLRLSDDLDDQDLPQPDLMLVAGPEAVYSDHPRPKDVYLLVEVSDTTLKKDRQVKLPLYAQIGVPELWIVNLVELRFEVYTNPRGRGYLAREDHALTEIFATQRFPDALHQWLPDALLEQLAR
ncbi:MAG: Uma2 family endonuclease [Trueperaceae bacterium]|nr:MAG: Uma2 family endonuclease [Trueperaceae bacterium]